MEHSDIILDIFGLFALVAIYCYTLKKALSNFNNGYSLSNFNTKSNIIILIILVTCPQLVSLKLRIILAICLYLSSFIFYKYLDVQNKTKNKINGGLQSFYMSEIKSAKRILYFGTSLLFVAIVFAILHI